ncbi:MAG: PilZ domain-containing protein [Planctomycetota bacterium]
MDRQPPAQTDQPELKLVRDKPLDEVGPYKFERRREHRWNTAGQVTFVDYGQPDDDRTQPPAMTEAQKRIGSLQLRDLSTGGIGVWSQRALPLGSQVAVFFPPRGNQPGYDRMGTVVRCESDTALGQGFEIGMKMDETMVHAA